MDDPRAGRSHGRMEDVPATHQTSHESRPLPPSADRDGRLAGRQLFKDAGITMVRASHQCIPSGPYSSADRGVLGADSYSIDEAAERVAGDGMV